MTYSQYIKDVNAFSSADRKSVYVHITLWSGKTIHRSFSVGDFAEYDSDLFCQYGRIESISDSSVVIRDKGKSHFLPLKHFAQRNYRFNIIEAETYNLEQVTKY